MGGGRRRRARSPGYRIKNKNPTQRCGELLLKIINKYIKLMGIMKFNGGGKILIYIEDFLILIMDGFFIFSIFIFFLIIFIGNLYF